MRTPCSIFKNLHSLNLFNLAGQVYVSYLQVSARKTSALTESSVRNKPVGVCCFTVTVQEAGVWRLKTAEETLACKVSKCTFASQLAFLSNTGRETADVCFSQPGRTEQPSGTRLFVLSLINTWG